MALQTALSPNNTARAANKNRRLWTGTSLGSSACSATGEFQGAVILARFGEVDLDSLGE
jgi:hypothetical protein